MCSSGRQDAVREPELTQEILEVIALLRERSRRRRYRGVQSGLIICVCSLSLYLSLTAGDGTGGLIRLFFLAGLTVWALGSAIHLERAACEAERRIQAKLSDRLDTAMIGPLIDAMDADAHRSDTHRSIVKTLTALLHRVPAQSTCFLTERQLSRLYRVLEYSVHPFWYRYYDAECVTAIIHALEQIGDSRAVGILRRLACIASDRRVVIAARECLPRLQERLAREEAPQRLVRAAAPPDDWMLRPAASPIECHVRPASEPHLEGRGIDAQTARPDRQGRAV
jgi:hypothetical protein